MASSVAAGTVTVWWRPGIPLEIARIKEAVLRWRGGVRYGGAAVTVVGVLEESEHGRPGIGDRARAETRSVPSTAPVRLRATGTSQRFRLLRGTAGLDPSGLRPGQRYRVTGPVIKSREGKHEEIWLELERAEPVGSQN